MKKLLLILCLTLTSVTFAQSKTACGNCNEKYLKVRTFGGTNTVVFNETMYVYYALYTPNSRTCLTSYKAQDEVIKTFEKSLSTNNHYKQLVVQYNQKYDRDPNNKNTFVGRAEHFTADKKEILKPFKNNAANRGYKIEFIELNVNLSTLFEKYLICD